ncbi:peptidyl-prolyl cis-trans isomerase FKBP8-like [Gouania willdenowi]|uniref:peptidyl-prolyl cis-trans isomerase FKBP8-like n=1 Tax=Gouania willdenowi TaxID=441366 RepID=UPI0010560955|nr:peptidyl-prolyl cis-trans isomerase FKBP8-like [Gouania willdenowi]
METWNENIDMDLSKILETDPQLPDDKWFDIFGNGHLLIKVLQAGGGRDSRPHRGQIVKIHLITRLLNGMLIDDEPDYSFTVGDWKEIRALDVAVQLMGVGEKVLLQVPTAAEFEITLLEVTDAPDLTLPESISKDGICSEKENELMEVKVKCLDNMAASMVKVDHIDEALQRCSAALQRCSAALQRCSAALQRCSAALQRCSAVLTDRHENVKAHFHMNKELALQDKYSEAIQTPREALELEPRNNKICDEVSTMIKKHSEDSEDDEKMLENPSSTHKRQAKSAWGLSWKWLLGASAVAIGGIALSVAICARK